MNKMKHWMSTAALAGFVTLGAGLAGCSADGVQDFDSGSGSVGGGLDPDNDVIDPGNGFLNDGSIGGSVSVDGQLIEGTFRCTNSAQSQFGATSEVGSGGLVGGPLSLLLGLLGGGTLTQLLNSVTEVNDTIDGSLDTHSTFNLTVGLLGGLLSSVDQIVHLPTSRNAGNYAVFAVAFPAGTVNLSLLNQIQVNTFLGGTLQESSVPLTQNGLDLLGQTLAGDVFAFVGLKATKPFDTATLSLTPGLVSADVGEAMYAYEMCTNLEVIPPPI